MDRHRDISDYLRRRSLPDQMEWENFYLLIPPATILSDPDHYYRMRRRLFAEGKRYREAIR